MAWQEIRTLFHAATRAPLARHSPLPRNEVTTGAVDKAPIVTMRDVAFRYQTHGRPVLQGCNLELYRGERLLLEGPSGGGKSTLAGILAGLRSPQSGLLLLHNVDQQTMGIGAWRERVVAAPQFHENYILTGTLAFNLLMGRCWPPQPQDITAAEALCRELGLGDLLDRMPAGIQQMVGESGWQLSHGERSRVYIARALLQDADLLILDESFAALDPANLERALATVLTRAQTLLVIAHP
ncbi:MAG: ATP-binding cassette domain-containing protein [Caldilineaceae bacterium]